MLEMLPAEGISGFIVQMQEKKVGMPENFVTFIFFSLISYLSIYQMYRLSVLNTLLLVEPSLQFLFKISYLKYLMVLINSNYLLLITIDIK